MRSLSCFIITGSMLLGIFSCKDATRWGQYTSKEGAFAVEMPTNIVKTDKKIGKEMTHFTTWKPSSFALNMFKLFQVSYSDCAGCSTTDSAKLNALLEAGISLRK